MFQLQILCQTVIYLRVCFSLDIDVLSREIPIIIPILIKTNVMLVSGSFTSSILWQTLCSSAPSTVHSMSFIGRLNRTTYQLARRAHSAGADASHYLGMSRFEGGGGWMARALLCPIGEGRGGVH